MKSYQKWWTNAEWEALQAAQTFTHLHMIARRVIERMPSPRGQVCGPISTGGRGSIEANLKEFERTIERLEAAGHIIFNQMPFEAPMIRILRSGQGTPNDDLLNDFYLPLFENRLVHKLFFMPDWRTSTGARWEHEQALRLGIEIAYLNSEGMV